MKKAQAAMDFVMTYGWALLIVLASIGAFSYYIGVNPSSKIPVSCNLGLEFGCGSYLATEEGEFFLEFKNLVGKEIDLVYVEFKLNNGYRQVVKVDRCGTVTYDPGKTIIVRSYKSDFMQFKNEKEKIDIKIVYKTIDGDEKSLPISSDGVVITNVIKDNNEFQDNIDLSDTGFNYWYVYDEAGNEVENYTPDTMIC